MFVDSHAHLFMEDYRDDLDEVIARARDAGVDCIVNPGTDLETSRRAIELAESYEGVYACVGYHPHEAAKSDDRALDEIEALSHHPRVVAIGEIGLDYHYDFSPRQKQREIFASQIDIARRRNLPIVIHSREAEEDTLNIIEGKLRENAKWRFNEDSHWRRFRGVFHCFPGDEKMARKVNEWGFYISIPGPVTFPGKPSKPNLMAEVASTVSLDCILLETDSPFLTPVPFRGKRNEPARLPLIARKIAELKGLSVEEVGRATSENVRTLFGVPRRM